MVAWSQLLLPVLISAVLIFFASSVIHMVIQWHKSEYRPLPNEDDVRAAIRKSSPPPGQYVFPYCKDQKAMAAPEMTRKYEEGPVGVMYLRQAGKIQMGKFLGSWFVYTLVVGLLVGYMAQFTVAPGAEYMKVFRVVGMAAWLAYAWQLPQESIWKGVPWSSTLRHLVDGLVYALITAGTFAWLWPR